MLALPAGRTTELLARLALDAGTPVRTDVLLEDLWAEPTGRNTLQSKVSQLRSASVTATRSSVGRTATWPWSPMPSMWAG